MSAVESIPAHLTPKRYKLRLQCTRPSCGHIYTKELSERAYLALLADGRRDPPCPRKACREAIIAEDIETRARNLAGILSSQRAPGRVGSTLARAVDLTARITMADHGLTNMRDNNRVGETSVPSLPAHQQDRADNFFSGGKKVAQANPALARQVANAATMINSAAYANQPDSQAINSMLERAPKPRFNIIGDHKG